MSLRIKIFSLIVFLVFSCKETNKENAEQNIEERKFSGEKYAFILNANSSASQNYIQADTIQYFTGQEAVKAYFKDMGSKLDESTYYIRNEKVDSVKYFISDTLVIKLKTFDYKDNGHFNPKNIDSFQKFSGLYNSLSNTDTSQLPFKIQIIENKVVLIEEIYIP